MSIIELLKEDFLFEDENNPQKIEDTSKDYINREFIVKLSNYIDSLFPAFGTFDNSVLNEIRKYMDESDQKAVRKIKEKIHGIILKEKIRMIKKIQNTIENVQVPKKKVQQNVEPPKEEI